VIARDRIARLDDAGQFPWIEQLLAIKRIPFPDRERDAVLSALLETSGLPQLDLDEPLRFEERRSTPRRNLRISQQLNTWGQETFQGRLLFDYGSGWVQDPIPGRGVWLPGERTFLLRDPDAERAAKEQLRASGIRPSDGTGVWTVPAKSMPRA